MASSGSQTVGSLIIDLRANVAQLQSDMDQVKNIMTKSSREMSSQMKADMNETRQTLALMRDDFGISIPRELRKSIASVGLLREAVLAVGPAMFALGFINLGMEAVNKITEAFTKQSEEATKEVEKQAEAERQYLETMKLGNESHAERLRLIGLIGATEDQKYASEREHLEELVLLQAQNLAGRAEELAYLEASLDLEAHRKATLAQAQSDSPGVDDLVYSVEKAKIDDLTKKQQIAIETAHNAYVAALDAVTALDKQHEETKRKDQQKTTDQALAQIQQIRNEDLKTLDPIAQINTKWETNRATIGEILQAHKDTTLTMQDQLGAIQGISTFHAQANELAKTFAQYEKQAEESLVHSNQEMQKMANSQGMNPIKGLIGSTQPAGLPQLGGTKGDFMDAQVEKFLKDGAEQSKFLEKAMNDLLTPTEKFAELQREIAPLMERYKDDPDTMKAITKELNQANPEFQKLQQASAEFGKDLSTELDNVIMKGESMHDMLQNLLKDLAEIALKALLLKPLEDFFGGVGGSTGGGLPGFLAGLFGGGHAYGGRPSTDQISLVGENGPELFVPDSSGTIVPNGGLGGTVINNYVDARGSAPGMELKMQRALSAAMAQSVQASVGATIERSRRS